MAQIETQMTEEEIEDKLPSMTEEEFVSQMKDSLLILTTSSPDKRDIYRLLFSSHAKGEDHHAGVKLYFTDSGALGLAPRKTDEKTGKYSGNLYEKAIQQLGVLSNPEIQELIRLKIKKLGKNSDPDYPIMGMTEDSGWEIKFDDKETEHQFITIIMRELTGKLRDKDSWLLDDLSETGFPGPNLKPLQEHLGGFHNMMELIYKAVDELGLERLHFTTTTYISFVSPELGKHFSKTFTSEGVLLTQKEYEQRLLGIRKGEAINSNFVHIPDGQADGARKTLDVLIREGLYTRSSAELPASYSRRELTEYLQAIIGKRRSTGEERKRYVNIAYVTSDTMHGADLPAETSMPVINDYSPGKLPTNDELRANPHLKIFDDANVIVLIPNNEEKQDSRLKSDPNLGMVLSFIVTAETDPESMGIPIVLDNRTGYFDKQLDLMSDAFAQGRLMGDPPFLVANTHDELIGHLQTIKDVKQRAPVIRSTRSPAALSSAKLNKVPADGVFTVFVGGGHANNSARDLDDAKNFGYYCAQHGWRIITGAGSVEGSMGAVHTGFIQYHLDQLQAGEKFNDYKVIFDKYKDPDGRYDAEEIILEKPSVLESLASEGGIPRDMFFGYSMSALLEMESPSGDSPPGITYFEAGNRVRRLDALLAAGTKVFMRGSIGTDEEFEETVKQHLEARLKADGRANDNAFADGTPDAEGAIIIYNVEGNLDKLLAHYGLLGGDPISRVNRTSHNIVIVSSMEELQEATMKRAKEADSWLARLRAPEEAQNRTQIAV